eukprot:8562690-Pyramimonas_sp.AAC.1
MLAASRAPYTYFTAASRTHATRSSSGNPMQMSSLAMAQEHACRAPEGDNLSLSSRPPRSCSIPSAT